MCMVSFPAVSCNDVVMGVTHRIANLCSFSLNFRFLLVSRIYNLSQVLQPILYTTFTLSNGVSGPFHDIVMTE